MSQPIPQHDTLHLPTLNAVYDLCGRLLLGGAQTRTVDAYNKALYDVRDSLAKAIAKAEGRET
jgi:hypothetical protein